jgi:hypothetical protein
MGHPVLEVRPGTVTIFAMRLNPAMALRAPHIFAATFKGFRDVD